MLLCQCGQHHSDDSRDQRLSRCYDSSTSSHHHIPPPTHPCPAWSLHSIKAAELVSCEGFQPGLKIYFTCLTSESQVQWCAGGKRVVAEATISEIISKLWLSDKNFIVG